MALARGLEITKLAGRMSCCVRAKSCGLDRGHFGCRMKVGVGLGWPESRGSPIAFALIERRGTGRRWGGPPVRRHYDGVASEAFVRALGEDLEDRGKAVLEASTGRPHV